MIECDFEPMPEYGGIATSSETKTKKGRYHGSMFWDVPEFSTKSWVVATKIRVLEKIEDGMSDEDIVAGCVSYINTPPPRKKFQRRIRKPKYGTFKLYKAKVNRDEQGVCITALLITDKRKSKHFWGKGIVTK